MSSWTKIKNLGEGSYGRVDLATNRRQYAAVKSATLEQSFSLKTELQFLHVLRNNPYVVQCYGKDISQEQDGSTRYNVLMELAEFGSLHDLIRRSIIPEYLVAYYSYLLLCGLSSIHRQGIIHCDIKPRNILVFRSQTGLMHLKLADFGLARYEWEKEPGIFRGTALYASPESVTKMLHGKETDIWSLGMTVLEMLYRGKPMRSDSLTNSDVMALTANRGPPEIPEYVSESCRDFLKKCLEMEAEDRWTADMLLGHDFIRGNLESTMLKPWRCQWFLSCKSKPNPFGSWNNSKGMFSAPRRVVVAPRYQPAAAPRYQPVAAPQYQPVAAPRYQPVAAPRYQPVAAPQYQPAVAPQYQLFPDGGNAFGGLNLMMNQLAI